VIEASAAVTKPTPERTRVIRRSVREQNAYIELERAELRNLGPHTRAPDLFNQRQVEILRTRSSIRSSATSLAVIGVGDRRYRLRFSRSLDGIP